MRTTPARRTAGSACFARCCAAFPSDGRSALRSDRPAMRRTCARCWPRHRCWRRRSATCATRVRRAAAALAASATAHAPAAPADTSAVQRMAGECRLAPLGHEYWPPDAAVGPPSSSRAASHAADDAPLFTLSREPRGAALRDEIEQRARTDLSRRASAIGRSAARGTPGASRMPVATLRTGLPSSCRITAAHAIARRPLRRQLNTVELLPDCVDSSSPSSSSSSSVKRTRLATEAPQLDQSAAEATAFQATRPLSAAAGMAGLDGALPPAAAAGVDLAAQLAQALGSSTVIRPAATPSSAAAHAPSDAASAPGAAVAVGHPSTEPRHG